MKASLVLTLIPVLVCCRHHIDNQRKLVSVSQPIAVTVAKVFDSDFVQTISASGSITTINEGKLAFKIGGIVENILVEEGEYFHKGQVLATLNTTEINARVAQASLEVEKAQRDFDREHKLLVDSVATSEQEQNSRTALQVSKKGLQIAAFDRRFAFIWAPADGFVTKKVVVAGEVVTAGMPILIFNQTNRNSDWILKIGVTDKEWPHILVNQSAVVELDSYTNTKLQAKVFRKLLSADGQNGTFQVQIKLLSPTMPLASGMFGKATIFTKEHSSLKIIPYSALIEANGNSGYVFVPVGDTQIKKVSVHIESFTNNHILIDQSDTPLDSVVISNNSFLNQRSRITIIK